MRTKYVITKSSFLDGWAVVSPPDHTGACEGTTVDSLAEAIAWMDANAADRFERFYDQFTVPEPGTLMEGSTW
jgi:hypothetical protein